MAKRGRPKGSTNKETKHRNRVPFGGHRLKLQLNDDDQKGFERRGMVARWFNEQDGRIERALAAGYNFVSPENAMSLGHGSLHEGNTDLGSKVSKIVSRGNELVIRAFLMEIDKKFYDEDQDAKEAINRRVDDALALGGKGEADVEQAYRP